MSRREKVFGPGRTVPLDRNAKARVTAYARAWSARNRQPGQHKGPITRAFLDVLGALLWGFHNAHTGRCFPSYEAIAAKAECCRATVYEAIKVLEWAGSNAYVFRDPQPQLAGVPAAKSENPAGTQNQEIPGYLRPVLRQRIGAQSAADTDRDAFASRDRQLAALKAAMT
jgi:hypothetical protein